MESRNLLCKAQKLYWKIMVRKLSSIINHNDTPEGRKEFVAPAIGMEFESYEDAYNYYNFYAMEISFRVRVKNSWFKRDSREKYAAVLCCSSQGFKRIKYVNCLRKDTRTGCPAMIRIRLAESKRWRILEVTLEHNHLLGIKIYKSMEKVSTGSKKNLLASFDAEVRTMKLYTALVIDGGGNGIAHITAREPVSSSNHPDRLNLRKGDTQAIYNYLCRMQLTNPNFFYLMDLSDEGYIRNFFWVDAQSRAASCYFGDVFFLDNTFLSNKYEIPLVALVGINHHGQPALLGCGLLAGETISCYIWLFKTLLMSNSGRHPHAIVSDRCKILDVNIRINSTECYCRGFPKVFAPV